MLREICEAVCNMFDDFVTVLQDRFESLEEFFYGIEVERQLSYLRGGFPEMKTPKGDFRNFIEHKHPIPSPVLRSRLGFYRIEYLSGFT